MRRGMGSQIGLLGHPAAPGAEGTDAQVDGTDGFVLFMLQFVAVANKGNWREGLLGQRYMLLLLVPSKKVSDRLGVFFDGASRTIFLLQGVVPHLKQLPWRPRFPVRFERGDSLWPGSLLVLKIFPAVILAT